MNYLATTRRVLVCACALWASGQALAQSVALTGLLGSKALLVIDGGPPKALGVGETFQGVKLLSLNGDQVAVDIAGERQSLRLGDAPVSSGLASGAAGNTRIVLQASTNGHFFSQGQINGQSVGLMVDTGASYVGISVAEANRMGLNYRAGRPVQMNTANGVTIGWLLKLNSVRLGSVDVFSVDAVVTPESMPYVLLGNSFLARFQMTRTNDQMVLEKRY
jgi:aspartyl protease family protein